MRRTEETSAGTVTLLIGPVGAGKSTLGRELAACKAAVFLNLDRWMVRLYGADARPSDGVIAWYLERRDRCRAVMLETSIAMALTGTDVILELGLVGVAERRAAYEAVRGADLELTVRLVDAPRELRRERVARRTAEGGEGMQQIPPAMFELASDAWQPVTDLERDAWGVIDS
ncbi:Shikimate kinase [Enhygromyxa salina]|uniref:Shikimate kinase n=1 Tax=Enhygromyxa salina TaxID=215803 RepID=A0A2S9XFJ5_9BACT|nr:ATP-binding protein [Enhygromyxa salina]PRP91635.1 Shikimate kinase [Enhygromyxa salina]